MSTLVVPESSQNRPRSSREADPQAPIHHAARPDVTPGVGEWRVVLVVLAALGLSEAAFRLAGHRLSKDVEHLQALPLLAERLTQTSSPGPKILFLGNSLTRYGVDEGEVAAVFRAECGTSPSLLKIVPDNTALADWYYIYRNLFAGQKPALDVLVIGFEGGHLRDAPSRHPDRLAQYYCDWSDWADLCRFDLPDFESRAAFLLAKCSASFGNRDRVTRRVFDALIPGYRGGMEQINATLRQTAQAETPPRYERLRKLLELAERDGVHVVLAAMPVPEPYEFDAELLSLVHQSAVRLLDLRQVDSITRERFFDGLHMDATAAQAYSRTLARALIATLPQTAPPDRPHAAEVAARRQQPLAAPHNEL